MRSLRVRISVTLPVHSLWPAISVCFGFPLTSPLLCRANQQQATSLLHYLVAGAHSLAQLPDEPINDAFSLLL